MMESLAFNIMARIDDLLYVDDAAKQRAAAAAAAAEATSLYNQERLGCGLPKRISRRPFSIQRSYCASPVTMPVCHFSQIDGSPGGRRHHAVKNLRYTLERLEKLTFQ